MNEDINKDKVIIQPGWHRELTRVVKERDEARAEAEQFRENVIKVLTGEGGTRLITEKFSWENADEVFLDELNK
jgi:hypothetical protein